MVPHLSREKGNTVTGVDMTAGQVMERLLEARRPAECDRRMAAISYLHFQAAYYQYLLSECRPDSSFFIVVWS